MEGISLPYIFPLLRSQTGICMDHVGQEDMAQLVAGTIPGLSHHISMQSHWRIAFGALTTLAVGQDGSLSQSCAQEAADAGDDGRSKRPRVISGGIRRIGLLILLTASVNG